MLINKLMIIIIMIIIIIIVMIIITAVLGRHAEAGEAEHHARHGASSGSGAESPSPPELDAASRRGGGDSRRLTHVTLMYMFNHSIPMYDFNRDLLRMQTPMYDVNNSVPIMWGG